jgi:hypothetical protein
VETETWRPVVGFPGYQVSDHGRVWTERFDRPLKPAKTHNGYLRVTLHGLHRRVHHLVLEAFAGPRPEGAECCHGNGVRDDNRAANLRWGTSSDNAYDRVNAGTHVTTQRTHCPAGHEYTARNTYRARLRNGRHCRECHRIRSAARRARIRNA